MKTISIIFLLLGLYTVTISSAHYPADRSPVKSADLQEYVGEYTFSTPGSPISSFYVTEKSGELFGEADSYGANKLLKQAEADTFVSTSSYGSTIIFVRHAETKKVTGLQLIIQGNTLEASKEK
jgi:hypothetical protein